MNAVVVALALCAGGAQSGPGAGDGARAAVRCTGIAATSLREAAGNVASARPGAWRAAKSRARRACREELERLPLRAGGSVGAALQRDPVLAAAVDAAIRHARVVGAPRFFADGGAELELEVRLEGRLRDLVRPGAEAPSRGDAAAERGAAQDGAVPP